MADRFVYVKEGRPFGERKVQAGEVGWGGLTAMVGGRFPRGPSLRGGLRPSERGWRRGGAHCPLVSPMPSMSCVTTFTV